MSARINVEEMNMQRFAARNTKAYLKEYIQRKRKNYIISANSHPTIFYFANDTAGFAIFDAYVELKKSSLYKQKVKKYTNDANKSFDLYQSYIKSRWKNGDSEQIYMDCADRFQDCVKKHVEVIRLSALQVMTRLQTPNRELLSYVITAYVCLKIAVDIFDEFFNKENKMLGLDARKEFREYRLTSCLKNYEEIVDILTGNGDKDSVQHKVAKDKNFQFAMTCLYSQITNPHNHDVAANEGINKNRRAVIKFLKQQEDNE